MITGVPQHVDGRMLDIADEAGVRPALRPAPPDQLLPDVSEPVAGYLVATYAAVIVITVVPAARLLGKVLRRPLLEALLLTFALSKHPRGPRPPEFTAAMGARLLGGLPHGLRRD